MADGQSGDWWQQDSLATQDAGYQQRMADPGYASVVKAIAEGRQAQPSSFVLRTPYGQNLMADVATLDPTYDVADAKARSATRTKFTSGTQGQNITSFNTALGHLQTLAQAADALDNRSFPVWNSVANAFENATGDPRIANFNVAKQAVVDELGRAFKGASPTVHDTEGWEKAINSSQSPSQLRTAISQAANLLQSRIEAMQESYNAGLGTTNEPLPMLNPHAMDALSALQSHDYISRGYKAVAPTFGGAPSSGDGGASPAAAPTTPGGPSPDDSGGGTPILSPDAPIAASMRPTTGTGTFVTDQDRAFSAAAEKLLQSPDATRADFDALAKQYGRQPFGPDLDAALAGRGKGVISVIETTPTGKTEANPLSAAAESPVGSAIVAGTNSALFGTLPKIVAGVDAVGGRLGDDNRPIGAIYDESLLNANNKVDAAESAHPLAALAGSTAGFIGGDAALGAVPGIARLAGRIPEVLRPAVGDALYGGAYGAGSSDNLTDLPTNVLTGAGLAAAGGVLGRRAVKGVSAALSPVANGAVQRLTDAGVTLTPGQALGASGGLVGRTIKGIEDRAAGFPLVGDIINNARRGGVEDFNRAAINDALAPIGETASGVGHEGIADMQQKVSDAIDRSLSSINASPDAQLISDVGRANRSVTRYLSKDNAEAYDRIIDEHVEPYLRGNTLTGDSIKSIKQGLDGEIANLRGQGSSPQDRKLADALENVRESFLDFADRADPSATSDYANARQAYAMSKRVEAAAAKSKDGIFTPNQFRQAVTKRGYGTTTANVASGSAPMQQLSTDASTILPSSVPDSGTAGRAALALAAKGLGGAALGGGSGYLTDGTEGALAGAALGAAAFSRPGLRAVQWTIAGSRGRAANTLGDLLRRNAALGGAAGVPLLLEERSNAGE